MTNLPDICVMRKILSSEYRPHACGKSLRRPWSRTNNRGQDKPHGIVAAWFFRPSHISTFLALIASYTTVHHWIGSQDQSWMIKRPNACDPTGRGETIMVWRGPTQHISMAWKFGMLGPGGIHLSSHCKCDLSIPKNWPIRFAWLPVKHATNKIYWE